MYLLHKRFVHSGQGGLGRLIEEKMVVGVENMVEEGLGVCALYKLGKMIRHPYPTTELDLAIVWEGAENLAT